MVSNMTAISINHYHFYIVIVLLRLECYWHTVSKTPHLCANKPFMIYFCYIFTGSDANTKTDYAYLCLIFTEL